MMNYIAYQLSSILSSLGYSHRRLRVRYTPSHLVIAIQFPIGQRISDLYRKLDDIALWLGVGELDIKQRCGYLDFLISRPDRIYIELSDILNRVESYNPSILTKGLRFPLGVDQDSRIRIADLQDPSTVHIGICGQSGSGKSVAVKDIIYSLARYHDPDNLKLIIIDPTGSLDMFDYLPLLIGNTIASDKESIERSVRYATEELKTRYKDKIRDAFSLVVVVDELAIAMKNSPELVEMLQYIVSLGRKKDVHLIISSQKFSDRYFSGSSVLLSNISLKIIFKVSNATDSGILGSGLKADKLLGSGDAYCIASSTERIQFPFISDKEILEFIGEQDRIARYEDIFEVENETKFSLHLIRGGLEEEKSQEAISKWNINLLQDIPDEVWSYLKEDDGVSVRRLRDGLEVSKDKATKIRDRLDKIEGLLGDAPDGKSPRPINKKVLEEILTVLASVRMSVRNS